MQIGANPRKDIALSKVLKQLGGWVGVSQRMPQTPYSNIHAEFQSVKNRPYLKECVESLECAHVSIK